MRNTKSQIVITEWISILHERESLSNTRSLNSRVNYDRKGKGRIDISGTKDKTE